MQDSKIDEAKIFIWGQLGERLKGKDAERLLAIAQENPDYFLSVLANEDLADIVAKYHELGKEMTPELLKLVKDMNRNDATFREIAEFMNQSGDMLSTGSAALGEIETINKALWLIKSRGDKA